MKCSGVEGGGGILQHGDWLEGQEEDRELALEETIIDGADVIRPWVYGGIP